MNGLFGIYGLFGMDGLHGLFDVYGLIGVDCSGGSHVMDVVFVFGCLGFS